MRLVIGSVISLIVGLGCFYIDTALIQYLPGMLTLIAYACYAGTGYFVGFAMWLATGKGDFSVGMASVFIFLLSMGVGPFLYVEALHIKILSPGDVYGLTVDIDGGRAAGEELVGHVVGLAAGIIGGVTSSYKAVTDPPSGRDQG